MSIFQWPVVLFSSRPSFVFVCVVVLYVFVCPCQTDGQVHPTFVVSPHALAYKHTSTRTLNKNMCLFLNSKHHIKSKHTHKNIQPNISVHTYINTYNCQNKTRMAVNGIRIRPTPRVHHRPADPRIRNVPPRPRTILLHRLEVPGKGQDLTFLARDQRGHAISPRADFFTYY